MKEWKRFLSLLLATAMCVGFSPVGYSAASSGRRVPTFEKVHENEMRGVAL